MDIVRRKFMTLRRILFYLLLLAWGVTGLKDLTISVPAMVRSGETVTLSCHYDLEGLPLYTIQWYLEETEFYRYVPEREPPHSTFNVVGIHVNVSESNSHDVTLVDVSRRLTGMYKCEVSAGSPSYHTLIERSIMEVVDVPRRNPTIEIAKDWISVGELLQANCTTGNSRPASSITWELNGQLTSDGNMIYRTRYLSIPQDDDWHVAKSTIDFKVTEDMFRKGRLHLRCIASIANVYQKFVDVEITEDTPRIASIKGESPQQGLSSSSGRPSYTWTTLMMTIVSLTAILFLLSTSMMTTASNR